MRPSYCECCYNFNYGDDPNHNNSDNHRFNFLLWEWNSYRKAIVKNRHGIEIEIQPENHEGFIYNVEPRKGVHSVQIKPECLQKHKNTVNFSCIIKNIRSDASIYLTSATLLIPFKYFSLKVPNNSLVTGKIIELCPGSVYKLGITYFSGNETIIGRYQIPISLSFQTKDDGRYTFSIARSIVVSVEDEREQNKIENSPFTNVEWPSNLRAILPTQNQKHRQRFGIPQYYYECIKNGLQEFRNITQQQLWTLQSIKKKIYPEMVTIDNYQEFWHIILWLDEMGQKLKLDRYNMENVKANISDKGMLEIEVPGLAEKRPSVIVGDLIHVRINEDDKYYIGTIKKVNDKTVEIAYLNSNLLNEVKKNSEVLLDIRFILGRLPLERMHQGVDQVVIHKKIPYLFPTRYFMNKRATKKDILLSFSNFYNKEVANNLEQKTAVLKILNESAGSAPYIVFGPPGTGKTITIVEAILQIKTYKNEKILVCAPANAACDMLTEKLMVHCSKNELIRIVAETVDSSTVSQQILGYTNFREDGNFRKITPTELEKFQIVVTTLILVGRYIGKYKPNIVFIDEAAQASEPEVDSAIGMLEGTQIILAGDHKQLGPNTSSKISEQYGLGKSLLERLWNLELYQSGDDNFITMLKNNFRSHSTILFIPNQLFYDNQLQALSFTSENDPIAKILIYDEIQANVTRKQTIKRSGQAIEFCNIISKESRYGRSPSFFNEQEADMVLKYVQALVSLKFLNKDKIVPEDIGIVTPYIRQVFKVKDLLKKNNFDNIEVGTTESFQGREKRILIITTVRAQADLLLFDKKYNLGFVRNEKRFNVAVTRAKSKLIIIGCAHVLCMDSKWMMFMQYCITLGVFCGAEFVKRTAETKQEIIRRFKNIHYQDGQFKKGNKNRKM